MGRFTVLALAVALLAVIAAWAIVPVQPVTARLAPTHNLCPQWAAQVSATRTGTALAFTLHSMGCVRSGALWRVGHTHCMRIAYAYTAHTTNWQYAAIGRQGCNLAPNGTWVVA